MSKSKVCLARVYKERKRFIEQKNNLELQLARDDWESNAQVEIDA